MINYLYLNRESRSSISCFFFWKSWKSSDIINHFQAHDFTLHLKMSILKECLRVIFIQKQAIQLIKEYVRYRFELELRVRILISCRLSKVKILKRSKWWYYCFMTNLVKIIRSRIVMTKKILDLFFDQYRNFFSTIVKLFNDQKYSIYWRIFKFDY